MKLNACNKHLEANKKMLETLRSKGWTIDRYGHAKKIINGVLYRYKFQHHTIRKEFQMVHSATRYNKPTKEWARVSTLNYVSK